MEEEFNSVCQNCGSDLFFNPKTGCLTCKYCESSFYLPTSRKNAVIVRQYTSGFHPSVFNKKLNSYKCTSCERTYFMTTEGHSSRCPNCGNSDIELASEPGFCADGVVPFTITKQQAAEKMKDYLKNNHKIPKELRKLVESQKLMAVLIPVWNFSFNLYANYSATEHYAEKGYDGMYYTAKNPIFGEKEKRIKSLDECATEGEDETFLDLSDEDDYAAIVPYYPEYSFGSRVDPITKDIHIFYDKIIEKAKNDFIKEIRKELLNRKRDTYNIDVSCNPGDVFFNFTYVPVYVNVFNYKKKRYKLFVSGTTGKVNGKTPTSTWYRVKKFLRVVGIGALLAILYKIFKK
jgi:predicted RNA-binding Zn-ribbon protein involved in translation (DUF1610 family)